MTEQKWAGGENIADMLHFLQGKASARKLRLYRCAYMKLTWERLTSAERAAWYERVSTAEGMRGLSGPLDVVAARVPYLGGNLDLLLPETDTRLAPLLRHIVGNPFRLLPAVASWPAPVVSLAEAVYHGADAVFALRDALLESGRPDLAEHFDAESWHPKGCFAIDAILGRE